MAAKIRKGDEVIVLAGKDKGKTGQVLEVFPKKGRVIVDKVSMVKRHTKGQGYDQGGIEEKEASIDLSNVALLDPKEKKATRVGFKVEKDGSKVRIAKRSGEKIG